MHILEVDAGNTRVKWRMVKEGIPGSISSLILLDNTAESLGGLFDQFDSLASAGCERVRVSSVKGEAFARHLVVWAESRSVKIDFAKASLSCGAVVSSYADASQMGVDRWLAMLAGYELAQGGCCIVDCGSALTIDLLDSNGLHLGGYILPGMMLSLDALRSRSVALNTQHVPFWGEEGLGKSTQEGMENGVLLMQLAVLEKVYRQFLGVKWIICGGDAQKLQPRLFWDCMEVESLVLDGLEIALSAKEGVGK